METKPAPRTGLGRIYKAFFYTFKGLKHALRHEAAFRQEALLAAALSLVLIFLPLNLLWKALVFAAMGLVLITELLNSAIEAVANLASPKFHSLAGQAKDMGSAAVFISLVMAGGLWAAALATLLF